MQKRTILFAVGIFVLGCGDSRESNAEDTESVENAYGEATCGAASPDVFLPLNSSALSANGNYDHFNCRNTFVVEGAITSALWPFATYSGPVPTSAADCGKMWARFSLWQRHFVTEAGFSFSKVMDSHTSYGWHDGTACVVAHAFGFIYLEPGTYKVVSQAGLDSTYQRVRAGFY
jgi:hypothetical protein